MSDREGGVGFFLFGIVVGALVGLVLAPAAGTETRTAIARRVRELRDRAEEKVDDIGELIAGGGDEEEEVEAEDEEEEPTAAAAREELRERLAEARRRRKGARGSRGAGTGPSEEDEPAP